VEETPPLLSDAAPGRRERERLARRRAILDAALAVFGDKGFDGTTVDEVAERAEFGKGTLYNYFPGGKEELYLTLFEEIVLDGMISAVQASVPDAASLTTASGVRTAFCDLVEGLIGHFEAHREHLFLFMKDGHRIARASDRPDFFARGFGRVIDAVAEPIQAAIAAGVLKPLPARPVAHLLMGAVRGHLMAPSDCGEPGPGLPAEAGPATASAAATFLTTVLLDGLIAPPGARPDR
jgi:AcrR family transcriptional regulator